MEPIAPAHAAFADLPVLLLLALILLAGALGGGAARRLGLPGVTGQILAGILFGPSALALFDHGSLVSLQPVTDFALALMTMGVGSHLELRRLRGAGRRLVALLLLEATLTPLVVAVVLAYGLGAPGALAILLGTLAVSTAPATVVAMVKETRARGVFVKTLVAAVALNNIACILLFEFAHQGSRLVLAPGRPAALDDLVLLPLTHLLEAAALGGVFGALLARYVQRRHDAGKLTTATLVTLLGTAGAAEYLGASPLLASLFLGVTLANLVGHREGIGDEVFMDFEPAILCVFFTLAGLELDFSHAAVAGKLAVAFVLARLAGKVLAAGAAMTWAGAPATVSRHLGVALVPQAGVAIGLLLLARKDPLLAPVAELLLAVGVTAVAVNEVIGPLMTRAGIQGSGEVGKDRARLIDFLHEETIMVGLRAATKEEAIAQLVERMVQTCQVPTSREALYEAVLAREAESSTCLGKGLAIPHAPLERGDQILGVMGLSREGLDLETPDGEPVHCMVLLATPPDLRPRHLEVMGALARLAQDEEIRANLFGSRSPAHAYVLLQAEELEEFTEFVDEMRAV